MTRPLTPRFGIMTAPSQVDYHDILRVWREADTIPEIEHAWLFDHLLPIFGDPNGTIYEGWTLLSALAAQTRRLRLGVLVTSNRIRPPAMLAKIATTVTSCPVADSSSGSARARVPASRGRGASTTPTACPTPTSRTRWAPSARPAP